MIDKRYGTRRWKALRLDVLHRDLWRCFVPDCDAPASVADHIIPVSAAMPSALFFDPSNLRAACRPHNVRRGVAARLERELGGAETAPAPRHPLTAPFGHPVATARHPRDEPRPGRFAYHRHIGPQGREQLVGWMSGMTPMLETCPSDCTLPKETH